MKRTLSLVLALVMVLGSFTTVFAAPAAVEVDAAEFLEAVGVLQGNDDGDLMLEKSLERRDAVILLSRLLGVEDEAAEFLTTEESPSWEDARTDAYYIPFFAWAEENGYFEGDDEGNFNPRNPITAQEYALVLLRAMGYEADGHDAWKAALETAGKLGLLADVEVEDKDEVVRGQMAVMTLNALKAEGGKLAEELGIELPTPAVLEVEEVKADNLKEVEVVFNQEVDADTITDSNVQVKGQAGSVVLKDDGVTAVITLNAGKELTNQKEYTAVVEKVKAVTGVEIAKTEVKFNAFDAELPEALEVKVTGPRQFTIEFSEPIVDLKGKVVVKQDKVTLGNSIKVDGNKAHVTVFTNFVEGKEYEVTVTEFEDYAGYKNIINVMDFTYEKDVNPPVATVEKVEQTYVVVSFDKPVKGLKASSFYHTFSAWTAQNIYKDAAKTAKVQPTDSVDKVYVYFHEGADAHKAIPAGSTILGIIGKDIKDNWGNALGNQEITINATSDRTAPEVVSIEVKEDNQLKITFSKEVKFERKNIEILDAEGKKISGLYISSVSPSVGKEFTVKYNKDLAGKAVTVSIKDVEDTTLFKNVLSLYTEVIEVEDTKRPAVKAVYVETDHENSVYSAEIIVQFNKKVDAATALDISNYSIVDKLTDKVYMLDGNAEFDAIDTRVKLTLTAAKAKDLNAYLTTDNYLQVINVKDLAGNVIAPALTKMAEEAATTTVNYTVKATSTTQLVVEFDNLLANIKPENFAVGSIVYGEEITFTQADSDTKTTLTFDLPSAKKMATNALDAKFAMKADGVKDIFGKPVVLSWDGTVEDEIKPVVAKVGGTGIDKDDYKVERVTNDKITIEFSEKMDAASFSTGSFKVEGRKVSSVTWKEGTDNKVVEINLLGETVTAGSYAAVSYELEVKDFVGNVLDLDRGTFAEIQYIAP